MWEPLQQLRHLVCCAICHTSGCEYMALVCEYMALVCEYMALVCEYMALVCVNTWL
jgi:hypothetical protein